MPDTIGFHVVPEIAIGVLGLISGYLYAVSPLNPDRPASVGGWRIASFVIGGLAFLVALHPPVDSLAETSLFSMHMLQHMLISLVGPGLIIAGLTHWLVDKPFQLSMVRHAAAFLTRLPIAFVISNAAFWLWHVPSLYELALLDRSMHNAEHISMVLAGMIMWWPVVTTSRRVPQSRPALRILYLFLLTIPTGFLSALFVFADEPLYPTYELAARVWSISALEDQRIGGLIMKLGSVVILWSVLTIHFMRWIHAKPDEDPTVPRMPS